ncbi:MAG: 50S ribosomal protein L4 [Nanoarchaeota archaeon]|mgnify:FL=1
MKVAVYDVSSKKIGEMDLPMQFNEDVRQDLISRAVIAIQSNKRTPYGNMPTAGKRSSHEVSKRRRNYRGSYGHGISRSPRKVLSRRGTRFMWVGAFAPNTVGGRRAHPPKAEKRWDKKINRKERRKAIRSAISATVISELVRKRGHMVPGNYPFALDKKFEELSKTKDVISSLKTIGLESELERTEERSIRSGKGKMRGRKYRQKKGPLIIVVSKDAKIMKAAANIPGVDVIDVRNLNVELLAPGEMPGRLTLWTTGAIEMLEKENLFK